MSAYGNDCHFFYNTKCTKGENCVYRHCEAAKDCMVTCTFWRQGICSKPNCPYRHADLAAESVQRNRQGIPCYWENQPVGCHRPGCQYQHSKPRLPGVPTVPPPLQNQPIVSESQLPDTSIPPPIFGQGLQPPVSQTLVPIPGAPIITPVIVQFSDSEVDSDKNSPVKNMSGLNRQPVVSMSQIAGISSLKTIVPQTSQPIPTLKSVPTSESIPTVKPTVANMPDLDYFIGKPFLNKPNRSPPRYYDASSDSRYSNSRSPSPRGRSISPRRRWSRSPSPRRSRSPRRRSPYLRDRSRSPRRWSPRRRSPSPRRRSPTRNLIFRPQDRYQQSHRPVRDRLNREENYPSTSSSREPDKVQAPKKISLSKIKDKTDTDDDKIKVKSLEEIQRAKALLSMGLIELQSGKIVKVGEVNKNKEEDSETKENEKVAKTKKIVKKSTIKVKKPEDKIKPKPKVKKVVVKKVEPKVKVQPNEESSDEIIDERQDEAVEKNFDDGDDIGEEPEIDLCEASEEFGDSDSQENEESEEESTEEQEEEEVEESEEEPVQYTQDIRRTVRKEDIEAKPTRKRKVIVDEEERKEVAKGKMSIHSRLGRKLDSTEKKIPKPQNSSSKVNVKSRLDMKKEKSDENLNNSNNSKGNKLSSGGIKSRLGAGVKVSSSKPDLVIPETNKILFKRTIKSNEEEDRKKEVVKRRKWNTGSVKNRLGDTSETNTSDNELKKIVIVRHIGEDSKKPIKTERQGESTSNENKSQIKSTLSRINRIIENKRETQEQGVSDTGVRKKQWNKLSVWSSRVAESIAAVKPTKKESDIDIFDSSSNDSLPVEFKQSIREPKPSKKGLKHEMPLYVPPARKRTVTSYDEHEADSPPKKLHTKKSEPESIKTYSQIMEEKRRKLEKQREKKQKMEEKAKKKKITPIVFSDKENDNILSETKEMLTNKQPSPTKVDLPVTKPTLLDSFSFTLTEAAERPTEAAQRPAVATERPTEFYKVDSSSEHIELLSALVPDSSTKEMDDILEITPTKTKSDDKWLEFSQEDLDMTGGETADDDDLLREIDELLA